MLDIEQAIVEVGTVYRALTGRPIEAGRSELPPEGDPRAHIEGRYRQLKGMLDAPEKAASPMMGPAWTPALEVIEQEHAVRFELDVPAVQRDQVGVSLMGETLVVRGLRAPAKGQSRHSERRAGPFTRLIPLPQGARRDGIVAALKDGVLAVIVPIDGTAAAPTPIEVR
jgi:HSP20 family protein